MLCSVTATPNDTFVSNFFAGNITFGYIIRICLAKLKYSSAPQKIKNKSIKHRDKKIKIESRNL